MFRDRPVKGFVSPFVVQPRTNDEEHEENKVTEESEAEHDSVRVKNNPEKRQDAKSPGGKETSVVDPSQTATKLVFNIVYSKASGKKHKTWDNDGFLEVCGKNAVLKDLDGKVMGRTKINSKTVAAGIRLFVGNKEVEILDQVTGELPVPENNSEVVVEEPLQKKFKSTHLVVSPVKNNVTVYKEKETSKSPEEKTKIFNVLYGKITSKKKPTWESDGLLEISGKSGILKDLDGNTVGKSTVDPSKAIEGSRLIIGSKKVEIIDKATQELFKPEESLEKAIEESRNKSKSSTNVFVPLILLKKGFNSESLVMPYLNSFEWPDEVEQKVSVDFCLVEKLREHQRHGVVFLYECLMGLRAPDYFGAILADEMGLGKTLQCITLIWTMLKKGPYGKPIIKRVLIVTPSSLCDNWEKEFIKWLGSHRIYPYVVKGKNKPEDFLKYPKNSVMIISYEMLIKCYMDINKIIFNMIICDEGHRLKNSNVKAAKILREINCKKRIILTGTPIQNDLTEFYALIDFINPGILGTPTEYKNYYEEPIVASQCPHADDDILLLGKERSRELNELTKSFILRRTQKTINIYLPHKNEIVVFCSLSKKQNDLYSLITDAWFNKICLENKSNMHLSIIVALKKICNHPNLFLNELEKNTLYHALSKTRISQIKQDTNFTEYCGKITIIQTLMRNLKKTDEKLVLVSYYTQTLDLFETICDMEKLKFLRLDGTTLTSVRSKIIDQFNARTDNSKVLLLSAKAGGVGLNLFGASRLVLFDSDWNPASDMQAMARIWRDGQKKNVYIYRLLTTGTIEEKIYQRQISKAGLSESVVDLNHLGSLKLSTEELKDLFTLANDTVSLTHDLMNCSCSGQNKHLSSVELKETNNETRDCQFKLCSQSSQQNLTINQLKDWEHYIQPIPSDVIQDIMLTEASNNVTFIFKNSTM
ncbi:hypothetical protein PUN28_003357 [Cardiocondyla obscurior]|uniref:DNA repair and recombination protein RAD54-like n=1 Tax=Cardiocondyla obscurior TaxID=286306 RepID=A0AAW2GIL3_9HYME